jgi:hypothetical protein
MSSSSTSRLAPGMARVLNRLGDGRIAMRLYNARSGSKGVLEFALLVSVKARRCVRQKPYKLKSDGLSSSRQSTAAGLS